MFSSWGVAGIILLVLLLGGLVILRLKTRYREILDELRAELDSPGVKVAVAPETGSFRGARADYGRVKCDGVICATDRMIIFQKLFGARIEINRGDIEGYSEEAWFLGARRGGMKHFILHLKGGNQVGFFLRDGDAWKKALDLKPVTA